MFKQTGRAVYRRGKLHFDEMGWAMVKEAARKAKKTPRQIVIAGLKRGAKLYGKKA